MKLNSFRCLYRRPLQAIALLTRIPVRVKWEDDLRWGGIAGCFPVAGYAVGGISLLVAWAWLRYAPLFGKAPLAMGSMGIAALLVAVGAWTTGALHLDGWADFCDGCFASASRERRLEIMADPHLGGFGVVGLAILLLLKFAALSSILTFTDSNTPLVVLAAPVAARWVVSLALAIRAIPLANPRGMAAKARDGLGLAQLALATLLMAPMFALSWRIALAATLSSLAAAAIALVFAKRQLGGINGDVLGAIIELSETTALMVTPC